MNIGDRIKYYRVSMGMKQSELAEKASVSRVAIGNYERGDRVPPVDVAARIATVLKISVNELLVSDTFGEDEMLDKVKRHEDNLSRFFDRLNLDDRIALLQSFVMVVDYCSRSPYSDASIMVSNLISLLSAFGSMMSTNWELSMGTPCANDYLAFLKAYERGVVALGSHKDILIKDLLAHHPDNKELHQLIYNKDGDK